jgi:hypothetical protein
MSKFYREIYNPMDILKKYFKNEPEHIKYNPDLKGDYEIIRQCQHDGTAIFTIELMGEVLKNLVNKESFYKPVPPDFEKIKDIKYEVGPLRIATVFGNVELPAGCYPGEKQRARIAVKCEYIY